MRKLTRSNVEELRKEMPVLTADEEREVIGGTDVSGIRIKGGYLISYDYGDDGGKYTVYNPDNGGQSVVFTGVTCSTGDLNGYAYQLNGIHVGENPESNFDIGTMIHEYGHYVQQENSPRPYIYAINAGVGSALANAYYALGGDYYSYPTEKDASEKGQNYIDTNYPDSGYKAEGL